MTAPDQAGGALAYGLARYRAGAVGKTLLVGRRDGQSLFAVAAGLGGQDHRDRFAVLARYLLRRDGADGYWLVFPADLQGAEHLAAEIAVPGERRLCAAPLRQVPGGDRIELGARLTLDEAAPLGDLLDGGASLPAVMRRELDRLALAMAQPLP